MTHSRTENEEDVPFGESAPKTDGTGLPPVGASPASRIVLGIAAFMVLFITVYGAVVAWRLRPHAVITPDDALVIALTVGEWHYGRETMRGAKPVIRCENGAWLVSGIADKKTDCWLVSIDSVSARINFVKLLNQTPGRE